MCAANYASIQGLAEHGLSARTLQQALDAITGTAKAPTQPAPAPPQKAAAVEQPESGRRVRSTTLLGVPTPAFAVAPPKGAAPRPSLAPEPQPARTPTPLSALAAAEENRPYYSDDLARESGRASAGVGPGRGLGVRADGDA